MTNEARGPKPWHRLIALSREQTADIEYYRVVITEPGHRIVLRLAELERILDEAQMLAQDQVEWEEADGSS